MNAPGWLHPTWPDLNEAIDRLLDARRPRAAFQAVHTALENIETSRLKRLLDQLGTCDQALAGTYQFEPYYISLAWNTNLERQPVESPRLFVHVLALTFKRKDGGQDPPEWEINNAEQRQAVWSAAYSLLDKIRRIPGTADDGTISTADLKALVAEARSLCREYGRAEIGNQKIGQILAAAPTGADGIWPCARCARSSRRLRCPRSLPKWGCRVQLTGHAL